MTDDRLEELLSAAADDAVDDGERAELDGLLGSRPEARRLEAELRQVEAILARVPDVAVPAVVHERLMTEVARAGAPGSRPDWFRWPARATAWRYGFATAAGIVLATTVYEMGAYRGSATNYRDIVGTVASGNHGVARVVDSYEIRMQELTGQVQLARNDEQLVLTIRTRSPGQVEIDVDFSKTGLRPISVAQDDLPLESFEVADQVLRLHTIGRRQMAVSLRRVNDPAFDADAKIGLVFSRDGAVLQQGTLSPAR